MFLFIPAKLYFARSFVYGDNIMTIMISHNHLIAFNIFDLKGGWSGYWETSLVHFSEFCENDSANCAWIYLRSSRYTIAAGKSCNHRFYNQWWQHKVKIINDN